MADQCHEKRIVRNSERKKENKSTKAPCFLGDDDRTCFVFGCGSRYAILRREDSPSIETSGRDRPLASFKDQLLKSQAGLTVPRSLYQEEVPPLHLHDIPPVDVLRPRIRPRGAGGAGLR